MGALIGKLGVPIQTSIAQSSLSEAYELCQNSGLTPSNPRLLPMDLGVEYKVSLTQPHTDCAFRRAKLRVYRGVSHNTASRNTTVVVAIFLLPAF